MKLLDKLNLFRIWISSYPELMKIWRKRGGVGNEPRVNYGLTEQINTSRLVFGGLVKLQDLTKSFPQCNSGPNILYLISSSLPYFPVRMALMAKNAGAKLVINQNGVAYPGWHGKGWEKTNKPMKDLMRLADHVIYQSNFCKISADMYLDRCDHSNFDILHNPVDISMFYPSDNMSDNGGVHRILLAGSHWSSYRFMIALDVLSRLRHLDRNVSMVFAGRLCWGKNEDEALEQVKSYAEELKVDDCIEITGSYSQQDAPGLMRSCSVLLHTKYNDPCPRVVVEAMACGLPVVYSATGGVPELVGEDAGVGVPGPLDWEKDHPPNADQLTAGIENVLSNLEKFSSAARERAVDKFDVKPWLDKHAEIFESVL